MASAGCIEAADLGRSRAHPVKVLGCCQRNAAPSGGLGLGSRLGRQERAMRALSFKRHRYPAEVIRYAVWLYFRFTLSFRDMKSCSPSVG